MWSGPNWVLSYPRESVQCLEMSGFRVPIPLLAHLPFGLGRRFQRLRSNLSLFYRIEKGLLYVVGFFTGLVKEI